MVSINKITVVNNLQIRDTSTHTYKTDKEYISLIPLSESMLKNITNFGVFINNTLNQTLTVNWLTNIDNTETYNDLTLSSPSTYTVLSNDSDIHSLSFIDNALSYLSVSISCTTAPTSGSVLAYLILYGSE